MRLRSLGLLLLPLALAACGEEEPTGLGHELLPDDAIRTFEVVLEPADYLLLDTSFSGYSNPRIAPFTVLARQYEGVLDANVLARYTIPRAIVVRDTGTVLVADSGAVPIGGELFMVVDSSASTVESGPLRVAAHRIAEAWDPATATWTYRDTSAAALPWQEPGGTPGAEIASATYAPGDTLVLPVDSLVLRAWADTTDPTRGALIRIVEGAGRLVGAQPVLRVRMRSSLRDTVVTTFAPPSSRHFVFQPQLESTSGEIRSGGSPSWRSFLRFRTDLLDREVPCGPGCTAPLRRFDVTYAELLLQPVTPPAGFRPEVALVPVAYLALVSPEIPLPRTVLGTGLASVTELLRPERFTEGAAPVRLPLTDFIRLVLTESTDASFFRPEWIAITPGSQTTFGVGTFASGPRLRLVLSTAEETQLP